MLRSVIVLNDPAVDATITVVDRMLNIPGVPLIFYPSITAVVKAAAAVAEVLQVNTWTPSAFVAGNEYQFNLIQYNAQRGQATTYPVYYKCVAGDTNVTGVCNRMKAIIRKQIGAGLNVTVAADGATTIVITSLAGNNPFTSQDITLGTTALTTAFVHSKGYPADVIAAGAPVASVTAASYASAVITAYNKTSDVIGSSDDEKVQYLIFADTADAGTAAWITALNDLLAADDGAGAVPLGTVAAKA